MLNVDNNDETPAARRQQGECVNAATCTLPADIMASSITAIIVMLAVIRPSVMEAEASRKNGVIVSSSVWHRRERGRRSSSYIHTHVGTHSAHVRTHDKSQPHNFEAEAKNHVKKKCQGFTMGRSSAYRWLAYCLLPLVSCLDISNKRVPLVFAPSKPQIAEANLESFRESCGPQALEYKGRREAIQGIISAIAAAVILTSSSQRCMALSPEDASLAYDKYASSYDELDGGTASSILGLDEARSQLLAKASGKVLEIGVGTGLNLAKYDPLAVTSLTVADISEGMLQEAKEKLQGLNLPFPVDFVKADATSQLFDLFGENAFDTVVDSFSLCVMGNEGAKMCLSQMTKVVKNESHGGRVLLLENNKSSNPIFGMYQDITAEAAASAGGKGCVYNQDVRSLIKNTSGLEIEQETSYVAGLFRAYVCVKSM